MRGADFTTATLVNDEQLIGRKTVGQQARLALLDYDEILNMPMQALRLDCEDHAFFDRNFAVATQNGLLLMKPRPHAVSDKRSRVVDIVLLKFIDDKRIDFAGGDADATALDRSSMHVQSQIIATFLFVCGRPQHRDARLMTGIAF